MVLAVIEAAVALGLAFATIGALVFALIRKAQAAEQRRQDEIGEHHEDHREREERLTNEPPSGDEARELFRQIALRRAKREKERLDKWLRRGQ